VSSRVVREPQEPEPTRGCVSRLAGWKRRGRQFEGGGIAIGLVDLVKEQIRARAPELQKPLVNEFEELTDRNIDDASDDPDEIVDRIQKKTGQPREQVEERVKQAAQNS
jgi:hypothetical protein